MAGMESLSPQPDETPVPKSLVESAARGDRSALREIYERTSHRVFRLMVRMVGRQDSEDLTQQAYVKAFARLGQFEGSAKFETWLYRLATNEALQHLRRERVRKTVPMETEPVTAQAESFEGDDLSQRLQLALSQLEPDLRTIISLKEDGGLSYREIAEAMRIPEGTVGSRLNRARRELARLLGFETS